jgi:hypothetical protein
MTTPDTEAREAVCAEILSIMEEYDRQKSSGCVDTPGGLEHMGDAWRLLDSWRTALVASAAKLQPPAAAGLSGEEIDTLKRVLVYPKSALAYWLALEEDESAAVVKADYEALVAIITRLAALTPPAAPYSGQDLRKGERREKVRLVVKNRRLNADRRKP